MKIAVIGARGFLGQNLTGHLSYSHNVIPVTRDTLNLLDSGSVRKFLEENHFDVIVNCAAIMTNNETLNDARNNLGIFMNFYDNRHLFDKFINTASGAEFDRSGNIDNMPETAIFDCMPKDSYGWGQNMKARLCAKTQGFYNIRIFNCFGRGEQYTRIFPRILTDGCIEISNDRYFDYFSIQDLKKVVDHCIENTWLVKDVNAVYEEKFKISEVAKKFCVANKLEPQFTVVSESSNNYTGSGQSLKMLGIQLDGLEKGFEDYL